MAFDWKEYLDLARFLRVEGGRNITQEAAFRCTVSRAYYAAFCHARNYARDLQGFSPAYKGKDHWLVRKHFSDRRMLEIVDHLDRLRQWRNRCDYYDTVAGLDSFLTPAINKAQEVFDILK